MSDKPLQKNPLSKQKRWVFNLIIIAIPVIFFLLIEVSLRLLNTGTDLSLFVRSENYPDYYEINRQVNQRYFTRMDDTSPTNDIFLEEKPDTCYRIFVLGGSSTRGFPYQAGTSFPRILYYRLQEAYPDLRIEVVNLSASAINSYTYIDQIDEILDHDPDLILLYGGHNEYYGVMGVGSVDKGGNARWMKLLRLKLVHLKTYQLLQGSYLKLKMRASDNQAGEAETLMSRIVKDKEILYDSKLYRKGVEQFRKNVEAVVKEAGKKNVPVLMSELVSNLSDQAPFQSVATDELPAAIDVYSEALSEANKGNYNEARVMFERAKDLDVIRFRAPEAMNEVLRNISSDYGLPLVPMKKYFEEASPNGLIGNKLMLEHLHPNIDGYFLMAEAFFNTIIEQNFLNQVPQMPLRSSQSYRQEWGFTELDSLIGDLNIRSIKSGWPFKPESETNQFLATYEPTGIIDSMAYAYLIKSSTDRHIEDEHIKLAQFYAKAGLNEKAYQEYLSLIRLHPYIADLYFDATRYLIAQKRYDDALELILSAPNMPTDYFYYYMTGTLRVRSGSLPEGIRDLEISLNIRPETFQAMKILLPLYTAYHGLNDLENKERILKLIRVEDPGFVEPTAAAPEKTVVKKITFDAVYDRAMMLIQRGELGEAMELLVTTNQMKETAPAHKLIGMIYLMQKNHDLAYEYCLKSYRIDPADFDNLSNLFILSLMKKNMTLAAEVLNHFSNLNYDTEKLRRLERLYDKRIGELEAENKTQP
jgi:tetratricopeptide (TPR) repeat protein